MIGCGWDRAMVFPSALATVSFLMLAACSSGPCDDASSDKMGQAFTQCSRQMQTGDGGSRCGKAAYDTYCRAPEADKR